ncbi:hypothetical protein QQ045_025827 [Rhodiola kirilowii]
MRTEEIEDVSAQLSGKLMLTLEEDEWEKSGREFSKAVILKLISDKEYTYNGIVAYLESKAWILRGKVTFGEARGNRIIARFEREDDLDRVLEGGPWNYGGYAILMKRWEQGAASSEIITEKLGIWVQFRNVPEQLVMREEAAKKLGNMVGSFSKSGQKKGKNLNYKFIRSRVWLDASKPIVIGFLLARPSKEPLWITVKYERLPKFCHHCGLLTHKSEECDGGAQSRASEYDEWLKELAKLKTEAGENEVVKKCELVEEE